MLTEFEAWNL